ncbi:MAG: hypothetical protein LBI87_08985 [Candidatus Accumulibacter sp.]|jgi:hypothetical protein|nr:hypothetical protein [Accumulibacter sp.]
MRRIDLALDYIARHSGARTPEIARAAGVSLSALPRILNAPLESGYLVSCKVQAHNRLDRMVTMNEYRLSEAANLDGKRVSWDDWKSLIRPRRDHAPEKPRVPRTPRAPDVQRLAEEIEAEGDTVESRAGTGSAAIAQALRPPESATPDVAPVAPLDPARATPSGMNYSIGNDKRLFIRFPDADGWWLTVEQTRELGYFLANSMAIWR